MAVSSGLAASKTAVFSNGFLNAASDDRLPNELPTALDALESSLS
jgi:hypothetical protein